MSAATCLEQTLHANIMAQDVIFAAGGDPVKKEKTMPYNIPIEEARRILGLSESRVAEVIEHGEKMSE